VLICAELIHQHGIRRESIRIETLSEEDRVAVVPNEERNGYAPSDIQKEMQLVDDPERIENQKKYLLKLDMILMPTISLLYFFEYLDRGNIAVDSIPSRLRPSA
jgi:hypothetical protein